MTRNDNLYLRDCPAEEALPETAPDRDVRLAIVLRVGRVAAAQAAESPRPALAVVDVSLRVLESQARLTVQL